MSSDRTENPPLALSPAGVLGRGLGSAAEAMQSSFHGAPSRNGVDGPALESGEPRFKFRLCHLLVTQPWASSLYLQAPMHHLPCDAGTGRRCANCALVHGSSQHSAQQTVVLSLKLSLNCCKLRDLLVNDAVC